MWVPDFSAARGFLSGLNITCELIGMRAGYDDTYVEVAISRGWEWLPSAAMFPAMEERGLDEMAMTLELLDIEIEVWQRRYNLG